MNRTRSGLTALVTAVVAALVAVLTPMIGAGADPVIGNDISWPQCGRGLPAGAAFGIVGVNDGKPYTVNPCLAAEYRWAAGTGLPPGLYMNTANPGPATTALDWYGQHAPNAACSPADQIACAYNYGYNAAADAFATASSAAAVGPGHTWWLDVETGNSWSPTDLGANLADVAGSIDYLVSRHVLVGVYSTRYQWTKITGGASLPTLPNWAAGARNPDEAAGFCSTRSFTGGPVLLAQFVEGAFDRDYACPGAEAVLNPSAAVPAPTTAPNALGDLLQSLLKGLGLNPG
jgi:hypothetical protein